MQDNNKRAIVRTKLRQKAPSFEGVKEGQTAIARLPIGRNYHALDLTYGGATLAQLDEIRVLVDNEIAQRYTGGDVLDAINQQKGLPAANGVIRIPFERVGMKNREGQESTIINTGIPGAQPEALHLEVDVNPAAVAPVLSLNRIESYPTPATVMLKVRERILNSAGAGILEVQDLALNSIINAMYFRSAIVTRVELLIDDRVAFDRSKDDADFDLANGDAGRVPAAGIFALDTTLDGFGDEPLVTAGANNVVFKIHTSGAGVIPVTWESVEGVLAR